MTRLLAPLRSNQWRTPSHAQPKDQFGNENCTRFRLTARLNDGHVVWRGWFDDRDEADAFLWALVTGSLSRERELWRLPTPWWSPDFGDHLAYDFATVTFLTTPTGSNQTFTSPSDWNNASNKIETLGSGAGGAVTTAAGHVTGGGAGAYNTISNFSFAAPGTTTATYRIAAGAAAKSSVGVGNNGNDSWFNGTALVGSSVGSKGGTGGAVGTGSQNGGAGGAAAGGVGSGFDGGRGGNMTGASGNGGSGGGGAAGPNGAGLAGADSASTGSPIETAGGNADNGSGGNGGAAGQNNGAPGTEWDASHGSGGGGGGRNAGAVVTSGAGGLYGGASGGSAGNSGCAAAAGAQGIIVITYTPGASAALVPSPNLPMLGW